MSYAVENRGNSTVARRDKTLPRIQNTSQNPKTLPRIQKHVPETKTLPRIQKHVPEFWILGRDLAEI